MKYIIERFLKHVHGLPEQQKMLVSISYSDTMLKKHFETILDKYSLTPPQYNLLRILQGKHPQPCKVSELKSMIINRDSDVSRMIERLRVIGLIDRKQKKEDRRAVDIVITEKGLSLVDQIAKQEEKNMFGPFCHLTEAEAKQVNVLLHKMMNGLKEDTSLPLP